MKTVGLVKRGPSDDFRKWARRAYSGRRLREARQRDGGGAATVSERSGGLGTDGPAPALARAAARRGLDADGRPGVRRGVLRRSPLACFRSGGVPGMIGRGLAVRDRGGEAAQRWQAGCEVGDGLAALDEETIQSVLAGLMACHRQAKWAGTTAGPATANELLDDCVAMLASRCQPELEAVTRLPSNLAEKLPNVFTDQRGERLCVGLGYLYQEAQLPREDGQGDIAKDAPGPTRTV